MVLSRLVRSVLALGVVFSIASAQVWERVGLPGQFAQGYYLDVFFLPSNPQYGWACGFNGFVVRTTNGGQSWQGAVVPFNGRAGGHLESVHFVDQFNGYVSGPAGVFRSTDGGATWVDVTPNFPSEGPWGCYFLSATTGVVLGGGCVGPQNFFRTTNGGQSWSLFQGNQPASGLTDAILYNDGSGFAVSSGLIWQTSDGGATWSVVASSGPNYWNEELTRSGTSFLIPWAGSTCSGQGTGGGGRFSTDNGQTWRSFSTGIPMFGAFLHDGQRGWICGYNRQVWYTSDGGQNWQYRGCGTDGDLDDIWMIDDTTGFVVGQGIYRYARALRTANKTTVDFGALCPPAVRYDTLYLRNRSWEGINVRLSVGGSHATSFAIVQPTTQPAGIASCDSLMVIVRYQPTSDGVHTATLTAQFSSGELISISLRGERIGQLITVPDTLVELKGVPAGEPVTLSLLVENRSTVVAQVTAVTRVSGSTFYVDGSLPLQVPPGGATLRFTFVPPDTGWFSTRVRIRTEPCSRDTIVTLRIYALSPIISVRATTLNSPCGNVLRDSVLVTNTGNSDLVIGALWVEPLGAPVEIVGTSKGALPLVVAPHDSAWVYVRYEGYGSGTAVVVLDHNDRTMVRNVGRPLRVALSYSSARPTWQLSARVLDFGALCVGESRILFTDITNTSAIPITVGSSLSEPFALVSGDSLSVAPTVRQQIGVAFTPQQAGIFDAMVVLTIQPCALADTIFLRGRGEISRLSTDPSPVTVRIRVGENLRLPVVVRSTGTGQVRIVKAELSPTDPQWFVRAPVLPWRLPVGASDTAWIEVSAAATPMTLSGTLCFEVDSLCALRHCVEVICHIEPREFHGLDVAPPAITFAEQRCQPQVERRSIMVVNVGTFSETLAAQIEPATAPFTIVAPAMPLTLAPNEHADIVVEYQPADEGVHDATLVLVCPAVWSEPQRVPLLGRFSRVVSTISPEHITLGILESCSPPQELRFTVSSRGLLGDTLELVNSPAGNAWVVPPSSRYIESAPNDSAIVALIFDPSGAAVGIPTIDRFIWESRVCPQQLVATIEYTLVRGQLDYVPSQLEWNAILQNSTVIGRIEVRNRTPIMRTIVGYGVEVVEGDAALQLRTVLPLRVLPGEQYALEIELTPRQVGYIRARLMLIEASACLDTVVIPIVAPVLQEHYWGRLSMRTHMGLVGDTIRVPVVLSTRDSSADALWRAYPEAIGFTVRFDEFVLDALGAEAFSGGTELPVERDRGQITVRVPRRSDRLLGSSDTLAVLKFWGLQSPPLQSELHFTRSWAETIKPYTLEHDDGRVILDACIRWMKIILAGTVRYSVQPNPGDRAELPQLSIESEQPATVECTLFSSDGRMQWNTVLPVERGRQVYVLPVSAAGLYLLRLVHRESGQTSVTGVIVH